MAKGYWVSAYRTIADPEKLAAYNKLAGPAVEAGGGRLLARGGRVVAHDAGLRFGHDVLAAAARLERGRGLAAAA